MSLIKMANTDTTTTTVATAANTDRDESSPLLKENFEENEMKPSKVNGAPKAATAFVAAVGPQYGWTANGLPLSHGSMVGEPMGRAQWDSDFFECLGRNDDFCTSDLEVCLLGCCVPCVLYGSNAERLVASGEGSFALHCGTYFVLGLIGSFICRGNWLAPCFSCTTRTAIRRKFNLEGSCEALSRSCGCCGSCVEDDFQREQCESFCDFATHVFCHRCALCQEGREIRRRVPASGFNAPPVLVMIPPGEQAMGREALRNPVSA